MSGNREEMWWELGEGEAHEALVDLIDRIRERDRQRLRRIRIHQDVYEGRHLLADELGDAMRFLEGQGIEGSELNFTQSAVDFVHAKVTAQPPSVKCASRGADWAQKRRASKLTRFVEAQSDRLKLPERAALALHMALRTGTSALKASAVDGEIQLDVVPVEELLVDPTEATYGRPAHLYQTRAVPRAELLARFSDDADALLAIEEAERPRNAHDRRIPDDADVVDVYEAWELPGNDGTGGRHLVALRGATLVDEEWAHPRFPFAIIHDRPPAPGRGFWGQGLVERLCAVQWDINELVAQVGESLRIGARLKVFVDGDVNVDHLADPSIGTIVRTNGAGDVRFVTPEPVSRHLIEHLRFLIDQLFSQAGMSQDAASSMKPAGLGSAVALLTYHDFQTQRHIDLAKRFSQLMIDATELIIDCARDLATDEDGEERSVRYSTGRGEADVPWSEVDMDRDQYVLELEAVSPVPESYAGRLQMIERMSQSGKLPESYVASLIEDPDLVRMNRMLSADAGFIEWAIDLLLDPSAEMPPVLDEQNFEMTVDLVRAALMDAVPEGAPPEVVDRFQQYLGECVERMAAGKPPVPSVPAGAGGGQIDPAMAAPVAATLG